MRSKPKPRTPSKRAARRKPPAETPSRSAQKTAAPADDKFARDLQARGEVAEADATGRVPREVTHVATREENGTITIKRVRFKLF